MKYIRTKDGRIIDIDEKYSSFIKVSYRIMNISKENYIKRLHLNIVKQADTIEELMMIDDLVFKKNGDIFVIQNQAYIDYYIKHKSVSKLFIKDSKGNYIRVAEENDKGELKLL